MAATPEIPRHDSTKRELTPTEARQAVSGNGVIYVLAIGIALVVIAYAVIYYW